MGNLHEGGKRSNFRFLCREDQTCRESCLGPPLLSCPTAPEGCDRWELSSDVYTSLSIVSFWGPERLSNDEILENMILEKLWKEWEAEGDNVIDEEPARKEAHHKEIILVI